MTHRFRLLWLGAALMAGVAPAAAHAQDSLFQQGRGMLEGVLQGQPAAAI